MSSVRYIVISPVRNEADYLPETIRCMAAQSVVPTLWVLINDGSTDSTGSVADEAATRYPWIKVIHRPDRGFRQAGNGVMEAFYDGYSLLSAASGAANSAPRIPLWNFLVKLDGDVSFPTDYFEQCFKRFAGNPKLGIGGGTVCCRVNGALEVESSIDPAFHVRGATKIYHRECWEQLGGLIKAPGWDTMDEVKANMLGWQTGTFPDIKIEHHRPTGKAYGVWRDLVKNGRANYIVGYHPIFMFFKCARRAVERPFVIGSCALGVGFLGGYLRRVPQVADRQVIKYFQRQQFNRLLGKKSLWG